MHVDTDTESMQGNSDTVMSSVPHQSMQGNSDTVMSSVPHHSTLRTDSALAPLVDNSEVITHHVPPRLTAAGPHPIKGTKGMDIDETDDDDDNGLSTKTMAIRRTDSMEAQPALSQTVLRSTIPEHHSTDKAAPSKEQSVDDDEDLNLSNSAPPMKPMDPAAVDNGDLTQKTLISPTRIPRAANLLEGIDNGDCTQQFPSPTSPLGTMRMGSPRLAQQNDLVTSEVNIRSGPVPPCNNHQVVKADENDDAILYQHWWYRDQFIWTHPDPAVKRWLCMNWANTTIQCSILTNEAGVFCHGCCRDWPNLKQPKDHNLLEEKDTLFPGWPMVCRKLPEFSDDDDGNDDDDDKDAADATANTDTINSGLRAGQQLMNTLPSLTTPTINRTNANADSISPLRHQTPKRGTRKRIAAELSPGGTPAAYRNRPSSAAPMTSPIANAPITGNGINSGSLVISQEPTKTMADANPSSTHSSARADEQRTKRRRVDDDSTTTNDATSAVPDSHSEPPDDPVIASQTPMTDDTVAEDEAEDSFTFTDNEAAAGPQDQPHENSDDDDI